MQADAAQDTAHLGVVALATLLRQLLLEMFRARISRQKRVQIAGELLKHVTSPQLKNLIDELVRRATELQGCAPRGDGNPRAHLSPALGPLPDRPLEHRARSS